MRPVHVWLQDSLGLLCFAEACSFEKGLRSLCPCLLRGLCDLWVVEDSGPWRPWRACAGPTGPTGREAQRKKLLSLQPPPLQALWALWALWAIASPALACDLRGLCQSTQSPGRASRY